MLSEFSRSLFCVPHTYSLILNVHSRYHHDIESYHIPKPLIIEGFGKVKDAVSSYLGGAAAPEVIDGVNIVSDGSNLPLVDESAQDAPITATQPLQQEA